jgi:hypothetical protein
MGFYPNITPDEATGIGAWSDQEVADAIVKGVGPNGDSLCALMPRLALSSSEIADLVAFLRGLAPVSRDVAGMCPGHGS